MKNIDKEALVLSIIGGLGAALMIAALLWLLSVVWSINPIVVILIVLIAPIASYMFYKFMLDEYD